jgi:nucleoside-diphosphate-sugar epimerase
MNNPAIIITGANGFIGAELVNYFTERQYKVFAFCRKKPVKLPVGAEFVEYDIASEKINEEVFSKANVIIHCAYVKYSNERNNADKINIDGTRRLLDLSRKFNFKKFVLLSSFSAHSDAISHYGKTKLQIEKIFDVEKDLILKSGLVLGNGGLFNSIREIILKNKFIPLIGGGRQLVQTIYVNELGSIIQKGIEENIKGVYAIAEPEAITMKMLYTAISCKAGRKSNIFIPLPYWFAELIILFAWIFHLKMPVSKENILGLKRSREYDITNAIKTFDIKFLNYKETIKIIN